MDIIQLVRTPRYAVYGTREHDFLAVDVTTQHGGVERAFFGIAPVDLSLVEPERIWCVPHRASGMKAVARILEFIGERNERTLGEYLVWTGLPLVLPESFQLGEGVIKWDLHRLSLIQLLTGGDESKSIWLPGLKGLLYGLDGEVSGPKYSDVGEFCAKYEGDLTFVDDEWGLEGYRVKMTREGLVVKLDHPWSVSDYDDDEE